MNSDSTDAYAGTDEVASTSFPHLGGNVAQGDPLTYCPNVWNYVIDRFSVESVMDLGSGAGHTAAWFFKKGLQTIAVEGLVTNVRRSLYPAIAHDLTAGPVTSVVDLVHCHEVVEHVEAKYLDNLLRSLACGRVVLMTHGLPGQDGHHHVNLQPMEYWVRHMQDIGYNFLVVDTERVRKLAQFDGAFYMAQSGLLFHRTIRGE